MSDVIDFYFDFSSPYGYFAAQRVDELAESCGRRAVWRPIMLGPVFKETGNRPLVDQPLKGDYCRHDWERMGRMMGVKWALPEPFPIAALAASRTFYWMSDRDEGLAHRFAMTAFAAYFAEGHDITPPEAVAGMAEGLGVRRAEVLAAVEDPAVKERLKRETAAAIAKGVCGSPFFVVDGEGFWGSDRLWMVKKWVRGKTW